MHPNRTPVLVLALASLALNVALSVLSVRAASGTQNTAAPYNVVLLITDEHSPRVLGCSGDPIVKTPTLDALAATGVRFTAAYCQNPICVPSRVSLVSGRMASNLNTFGNTTNQQYRNITTLADAFVQAGYQTAWFGKTHWGDPRFPSHETAGQKRATNEAREEGLGRLPQESRVSDWPVEKNPDHLTTNDALAFIDKHRAQPFFVGVSLVKPHFPFTIQQKYYDMYKGRVGPPRVSPQLLADLPALSKEEREKYNHGGATEEDILRTRALYYGMVTYIDEEFGRVMRQLEQLGLRENTLVIYTSDHGEMLGNRGIWYKNSFYEDSAGVPFIWSLPRVLPQGRVVSSPAMNLDIFPTLVDLLRLPKPSGLEGSSLLPVLQGTDDGRNRVALSENYRGGHAGRMIRTARWKYFFYTNGEEYLYDLEADPGEETNLVARPEFRRIADDLKQKAAAGWNPRGARESSGAAINPANPSSAPGKPAGKKEKKKK